MGNTVSGPSQYTFVPHVHEQRSQSGLAKAERDRVLATLQANEGFVRSKALNIIDLAQSSRDAFEAIGQELKRIGNVVLRALVAQAVAAGLTKLGQAHLAAAVEAAWVVNEVRELADAVKRIA